MVEFCVILILGGPMLYICKKKAFKSTSGFTLAETVVALGVLVVVVAGLLILFLNCIFLNQKNRQTSCALSHAQYVLEEIIGEKNINKIIVGITSGKWDFDSEKLPQEPYKLEPLKNEIIKTTFFANNEPLGISVRVEWSDPRNYRRSVELRTLKTNTR